MSVVDLLQQEQERIVSSMMSAERMKMPEDDILVLESEYKETVKALSSLLGSGAPCSDVDMVAWAAYQEINGDRSDMVTLDVARTFLGLEA